MVQSEYNYKACNVPVARAILDALVKNDGTCAMFASDPDTFEIDWKTPSLFGGGREGLRKPKTRRRMTSFSA
jgi:hypothetical protein